MVDDKKNESDSQEAAVPAMLEDDNQTTPQTVELGPSSEGDAIEDVEDVTAVAEAVAVPAPIPEVSQEGEAVANADDTASVEADTSEDDNVEEKEPVLIELSEAQEIALEKIDTHALWVIKRLCAKGHKA